ncbi:hypothetical protein DL764_010541 [Monosporascus ibericus]|uniref:Uncharacterized protein n=1 Tax=Monosporascus ibericus TaxID=155417 RepID=A0A4Q4SV60_9PEZI|nr:hypothetical protein DL764_010541 [Monosporascus ibericus]
MHPRELDSADPVVVIGFAFRFPGDVVSEDAFWNVICRGSSTMSEVPQNRYNVNGIFSPNRARQDTVTSRGGHFIAGDIAAFDAPFFTMGTAEAKAMDPQLRLLLETTYHALESAGIPLEAVQGSSTSVYIGNLVAEYSSLFTQDSEINAKYEATGNASAMLSNRLSWFYDLHGPSITLDTACSSSLTGLHLACNSLIQGEVEMRANGYSRGEGVGVVVLKRLSKAIENGDTIRAVIRGTSINQDGRTPSISQPSQSAQASLIRMAYENAGLDFDTTRYFEAHGTGTPVGDPIETQGISAAFSEYLTPESPMFVGSVKANIGHLEAAAGIASLIKTILVLENGIIPPNALLENLNPAIRADEWHLRFPTTTVPWPTGRLRRASVNSFGVGGANAHVVLDDALHYLQSRGIHGIHKTHPGPNVGIASEITMQLQQYTDGSVLSGSLVEAPEKYPQLFLLSAADEYGIHRLASTFGKHLGQPRVNASPGYLQDLAFTLGHKRSLLTWKAFALGSSVQDLQQNLADLTLKPNRSTEAPAIYFAFTGQGAQWATMGHELLGCYQVFRDSIEHADEYLRSLGCPWSLIDELSETLSGPNINNPIFAQPLCTALQIALVDLLASWNVHPRAVVGHSSGEIAAAYCTGALSKNSALRVAYYRGEATETVLESESEKGAMIAVALSEHELKPYIAAIVGQYDADSLACGCINGPKNTTVTGVGKYIDDLARRLQMDNIFARRLNVPVAYHSKQMLKVADKYRAALEGSLHSTIQRPGPTMPTFISSVTGRPACHDDLIQPDYWIRNLTSKVQFHEALKQLPWTLDHKFENTVVYPASGMVVMVLEAVRTLTTKMPTITGYRLRDVTIPNALVIPETEEGIEAQLQMHCHDTSSWNQDTRCWDFWIHSVSSGEWKLHCSGQVSTMLAENIDPNSEETDNDLSQNSVVTNFKEVYKRCSVSKDSKTFYQDLQQVGFHFGESFRTLRDIMINQNNCEATASVSFGEWQQRVRQQELEDHIIHPATLDSLFHVIFAAQLKQGEKLPTMMPIHLTEVSVSCELLRALEFESLSMYGSITGRGVLTMEGDVTAENSLGEPMVTMRGCRLTSVHTVGDKGASSLRSTNLFHQLDWKPDIDFLSRVQVEEYCRRRSRGTTGGGVNVETELIYRHFMSTTLDSLKEISVEGIKPHLQKYIRWSKSFLERERCSTMAFMEEWPSFKEPGARPRLIEEFAASERSRGSIVSFCRRLVPILTEEIDPLDILFNGGIAETIYRSPLLAFTAVRLAAYVDLLAHKNSAINILEVGAGTGSTTGPVLEALSHQGKYVGSSARFVRYDFTDVSPSFFAAAQERYAKHASRMRFKTLNLECDPEEQGFELGSYDIVIAASVLHATSSIDRTLLHVRKLLKPGGQLIFSEPTNRRMATTSCMFGVLPGWWLSTESYRTSGPLLTKQEWNEALLRAGFGELQMALSDVERFPSMTSTYDQCISLLEVENTIMSRMTEFQFASLQQMVRTSKQILWVNEKCGERPEIPEAAMMAGFGKSIMREDPTRSFIHLNLHSASDATAVILRIVDQCRKVPSNRVETDLLEENGVIYIPRVVEAPQINSLHASDLHGSKPEPLYISNAGDRVEDPLELRFIPGRLASFHFCPDVSASLPLQQDEVKVKVKATGISSKDAMVFFNQIWDDNIGQEFSGIITEVGADAEGIFRPGDGVCGIVANGSFRTYVRVKKSHIIKIPPNMSFAEAGSISFAFATAQYGLCHLARLKSGESLLIHDAASPVGQGAIQIAQRIGVTLFLTFNTAKEKKILVERYGIKMSHFFPSRHPSLARQVMQRTAGKGVDVVLNSLSNDDLTETWKCVAPLGRYIETQKRGIGASKSLPVEAFQRNVAFCSLDISVVSEFDDKLMGEIMQEVKTLFHDEIFRHPVAPHPLKIFKRSGFEGAFRLLQHGPHAGKAVIDWEAPDTIQSPLDYEFDDNATYVITGGLGGIGRSTAAWMARQGARHLVLLSRSGVKSDAAKALVTKLEADGVSIYAPSCDVSEEKEISSVIEHVEASMPAIKGCIHGAMVIENRIFHDYSLRDFHRTMGPKVRATWNLHRYLPTGLDFFVILSSLAGVNGSSSQSNYAAANAFQDAFARFRHTQGQHCISLDLGIVRDVGYIAERVDVAQFLAMSFTDHKVLTERDVHFMLKYACSPFSKTLSSWETQVVGALTTPAFVRRGGVLEDHGWMRMPLFGHLYQMEQEEKSTAAAARVDSTESQLRKVRSLNEAAAVVTRSLAKRLARALAVPVEDIDVKKPAFAYGVDSLVAVELQFWFSNEINADIPVIQILGNSTIAQLGWLATELSGYVPASSSWAHDLFFCLAATIMSNAFHDDSI